MMGLRGENPVPTLSELLPVVVVENDRPEWSFAGLELPWGTGFTNSPAIAGELSYVVVFNPVGSGIVSVVTTVQRGSDGSVHRLISGFLDATAVTEFGPGSLIAGGRDSGFFPEGAGPAGQPRTATRVAIGTTVGQMFGAIAHWSLLTAAEVSPPTYFCVLRPGSYLASQSDTAATAINVQFLGYERAQERGDVS